MISRNPGSGSRQPRRTRAPVHPCARRFAPALRPVGDVIVATVKSARPRARSRGRGRARGRRSDEEAYSRDDGTLIGRRERRRPHRYPANPRGTRIVRPGRARAAREELMKIVSLARRCSRCREDEGKRAPRPDDYRQGPRQSAARHRGAPLRSAGSSSRTQRRQTDTATAPDSRLVADGGFQVVPGGILDTAGAGSGGERDVVWPVCETPTRVGTSRRKSRAGSSASVSASERAVA